MPDPVPSQAIAQVFFLQCQQSGEHHVELLDDVFGIVLPPAVTLCALNQAPRVRTEDHQVCFGEWYKWLSARTPFLVALVRYPYCFAQQTVLQETQSASGG